METTLRPQVAAPARAAVVEKVETAAAEWVPADRGGSGLRGSYFFGDFCSGTIWALTATSGVVTAPAASTGLVVPNLSTFGQDGNGEIYAADLDGVIYRVVAAPR